VCNILLVSINYKRVRWVEVLELLTMEKVDKKQPKLDMSYVFKWNITHSLIILITFYTG